MNPEPLPVKTAVLSHSLPPDLSGSAVRIGRIMGGFAPESYCLVASRDIADEDAAGGLVRLPAAYHRLSGEWRRLRISAAGPAGRAVDWINGWLVVAQRARSLGRVLKKERCRAIVAFTGDLFDIPAAWLASIRAGCSMIPALDDDFIFQWPQANQRRFARAAERWVLRRARGAFAISEYLRDEYAGRYGMDVRVLDSPTPHPPRNPPDAVRVRRSPDHLRILFAGSVYHVNLDAIALLLRGLERLKDIPVRLQIYTSQNPGVLTARGIRGPMDVHPGRGPDGIESLQADSDLLFLPLGFRSGVPEVVRTSCPTKLSDYLVSGRPILAYAPADSFLSWYVKSNGCGLVVDREDADEIAAAVRRLATDEKLRTSLVRRALECAGGRWSPQRIREVFRCGLADWAGTSRR